MNNISTVWIYIEGEGWVENRYSNKADAISARDRFISEYGEDNVDWIIR